MLIRSQDRTRLINLNETFSVYIKSPKDTDLKYTIYAENEEDNRKWLGDYSEFWNAEGVLEEIEIFYNDKNSRHLIYPMPEDDAIKSRTMSNKKRKK